MTNFIAERGVVVIVTEVDDLVVVKEFGGMVGTGWLYSPKTQILIPPSPDNTSCVYIDGEWVVDIETSRRSAYRTLDGETEACRNRILGNDPQKTNEHIATYNQARNYKSAGFSGDHSLFEGFATSNGLTLEQACLAIISKGEASEHKLAQLRNVDAEAKRLIREGTTIELLKDALEWARIELGAIV